MSSSVASISSSQFSLLPAFKPTDITAPSTSIKKTLENPSLFEKFFKAMKKKEISNHAFQVELIELKKTTVQDLSSSSATKGKQIEALIEQFETKKKDHENLGVLKSWQEGAYYYARWGSELASGLLEFMERVLPKHILEDPYMKEQFNRHYRHLNYEAATIIESLDLGLNGLTIIYKVRLIQQISKIVTKIKASCADQTQIPKSIREWEAKLKTEMEELNSAAESVVVRSLKNVIDFSKTSFEMGGLPKCLAFLGNGFIQGLGVVGSLLGNIACGINLHQANQKSRRYFTWMDTFKKWKESIQPTSKNLLAEREAVALKKLGELRPRAQELMPVLEQMELKVKELKQNEFLNKLDQAIKLCANENVQEVKAFLAERNLFIPKTIKTKADYLSYLSNLRKDSKIFKAEFENWFSIIRTDALLQAYIDQQETIVQITKNALIQMVDKKHHIEAKFTAFILCKSSILFGLSVLVSCVSIALLILGVATLPVGGAGAVLIALTGLSGACGYGLFAVGHYLAYRYRPSQYTLKALTNLVGFKIFLTQAHRYIYYLYSHHSKQKRVKELALAVFLAVSPPKQAEQEYHEARELLQGSRERMKEFQNKIDDLEAERNLDFWRDFAHHALLKVNVDPQAFDTLQAFKLAFEKCDLSLLDGDTKKFLETHLGMDLEALEEEIKNDPEAIRKALQNFFILNETNLDAFIKQQEVRIKHGLITHLTKKEADE